MTPVPQDALNRAPSDVEEQAVRWFVAVDKGLSAQQRREFEAWLKAGPGHRELFEELGGTWEIMGQATAPEKQPANSSRGTRNPYARIFRAAALPLAAAAAIALGYFSWWQPAHYSGETRTVVGAMRVLKLPDGSVVELNTDSTLHAAFTPAERRVILVKGEAHFQVAKNKERPFIVESGGVGVRAVGTAFDVRLKPDRVDVLVTEGRVQVRKVDEPRAPVALAAAVPASLLAELGAGEQLSVPLIAAMPMETKPVAIATEDIQRRLAWQQRKLDFADTPLSEMVAEFNRYNSRQLVIADAALGAQRFGGIFRADDPEGFIRMLKRNFNVETQERDGVTVLKSGK